MIATTIERPELAPSIPTSTRHYEMPVRIVSIYPVTCRHTIPLLCMVTYELPAATRGGWTYLDIEPTFRWLPDVNTIGEKQQNPSMVPRPESALSIADSLVKLWTSDPAVPNISGKPGIDILSPGESTPSKRFLDALIEQQTLFASSWIRVANDMYIKGQSTNINETPRILAEWLYGSGAAKLPWFQKPEYRQLEPCIACGEDILSTATSCPKCNKDLIEHCSKHEIDPGKFEVVAKILANKRASVDSEIERLKRENEDLRAKGKPVIAR